MSYQDRICAADDAAAIEAGFRPGEPLAKNPNCPICHLCNAMINRNGRLTCRSCGHITTYWPDELLEKLGGYTFTVEDDPDYTGFFSVYAGKRGSEAEVAGKIGEHCVAAAIASSLNRLCEVIEL